MSKNSVASLFGHTSAKGLMLEPSNVWVIPDCNVGIEIEVEGINLTDRAVYDSRGKFVDETMKTYWNIVKDGSLRNGWEFVTPILYGKDLCKALELIEGFLKKNKGAVFTYRCSTHVHLDVRDMDKDNIMSLLFIYLLYENYFFKFWPEERYNNNYCVPLTKCYRFLTLIGSLVKTKDEMLIREAFGNIQENSRYAAFNFNALVKYGSIEFRHGSGTCDSKLITTWINIIMCLKKFAMQFDDSCEEVIKYITKTPFDDLNQEVFGELSSSLFRNEDIVDIKNNLFKTKGFLKAMSVSSFSPDVPEFEYGTNSYNEAYNRYIKNKMKIPAKPKQKVTLNQQVFDIPQDFRPADVLHRQRIARLQRELEQGVMLPMPVPEWDVNPNDDDNGEVE